MMLAPSNQWPADVLRRAFTAAAEDEAQRRTSINVFMTGGVRLSTRPDAVERDIMRNWLNACAPAGTA